MNGKRFDLHQLGAQLWYDVVSRQMLEPGRPATRQPERRDRHPDAAMQRGEANGPADSHQQPASPVIRLSQGSVGRAFTEAVLELQAQAERVRPLHEASHGRYGWVSLNISALLADDAIDAIDALRHLSHRVARDNLLMEIPATTAGLIVLEQAVYSGIPVHMTLLLAREHCIAVAKAFLRGIERRRLAGKPLAVPCVASLVIRAPGRVSDDESKDKLEYRLGIAIALRSTRTWNAQFTGSRWQALMDAGALRPRLLWNDDQEGQHAASLLVEACNATGLLDGLPPGQPPDCGPAPAQTGTDGDDGAAHGDRADPGWAAGIDHAEREAELERQSVLCSALLWSALLLRNRPSDAPHAATVRNAASQRN